MFDTGINILIGTNGGGKTNLQRIIALTLTKYFIYQYQFKKNDQEAAIELSDPWTQRTLERIFPRYFNDNGTQIIEIEIAPDSTDIENITSIGTHLEQLNQELSFWERKYDNYIPIKFVDQIKTTPSFTYVIRDLKLEEPPKESASGAFLDYLRTFFIFVRVAHRIPKMSLAAPVFFFSSDRALSRSFQVQAGQLTEQTYFDGYRSAYHAATGESTNLMQWSAQHFVRLHRTAVIEASNSSNTWQHFFEKYPDVQLLERYMKKLGYDWGFAHDDDQLSYVFVLIKDGTQLSPEMFSSGEREIVHFLLALFALNVRGGLVLVDEPELHLHPRWQNIFLSLFKDLSPERNCQFIITTHSPTFVTPETINSITRIFRTVTNGSSRIALKDVELPEKKSLVRMINSQNNERLFFADKVVLVEGISDRLIFSSLIESVALLFRNNDAIEVIEVGGKGNFNDYRNVLDGLLTPAFSIADRDYLINIGSPHVKELFIRDPVKQSEILVNDKHSTDRMTLIDRLDTAVREKDIDSLVKFLDYFRSRITKFKKDLTASEAAVFDEEIIKLRKQQTFVLHDGDVEDYLPNGINNVKDIVELLTDRNWINRVTSEQRRMELASIACAILGLASEQCDSFFRDVRAGNVCFPEPQPFSNSPSQTLNLDAE